MQVVCKLFFSSTLIPNSASSKSHQAALHWHLLLAGCTHWRLLLTSARTHTKAVIQNHAWNASNWYKNTNTEWCNKCTATSKAHMHYLKEKRADYQQTAVLDVSLLLQLAIRGAAGDRAEKLPGCKVTPGQCSTFFSLIISTLSSPHEGETAPWLSDKVSDS